MGHFGKARCYIHTKCLRHLGYHEVSLSVKDMLKPV